MTDPQKAYWSLAYVDLTKNPKVGSYLARGLTPYHTIMRPYESPKDAVKAAFARDGEVEIVAGKGTKEAPFEVRLISSPTWPVELSFLVCSCSSCLRERETTTKHAKDKLQRLLMGGTSGPFSRSEASLLGKEALMGLFPFIQQVSYASYAVYSNDKYYYLTLTALESPAEVVFRLARSVDLNTTLAEKVVPTSNRPVHELITAACEWATKYLEETV